MNPSTANQPEPDTGEDAAAAKLPWPLTWLLQFKIFDALRYRQYRLLWTSHVFSSMATWMDQVTRGWLIYELTNSSLQLGMVRGVQALPILLLSPIAGSTADRYSRKAQITIAQIIDGLLYGTLALAIFSGQIVPWHVYVTAIAMACVQTFQQPSRGAIVSNSVPTNRITNAIGLNAIMFNVARITGPALAGLLIAGWSTGGAYAVQAAFYFLATFWSLKLAEDKNAGNAGTRHGTPGESFTQSIVEGWKFSWRNVEVRTGLLVASFASLFIIPFMTLLPVYARDILAVGAKGQGLLLTAMGAGALASSVMIASLGDRMPRGILMVGGVAVYGVLVVGFALCGWFALSLAMMVIIGVFHVAAHALVHTVIQTYSPPEYRGRTAALYHMTQVIHMLGDVWIGALAAAFGAQWATIAMSVAGTISMIAIYFAIPRVRDIR